MKTAMIWGASGGIGQALVTELTKKGWLVVAISRDGEQVPGAETTLTADVTNSHSVSQAVLAAAYEVERVDLWIYAAGDILASPVEQVSPDEWRRVIGVNLDGPYLATHYSLPLLAEDAYLVYLGAVSERLRLPGLAAYAAAKTGLEAFAEALRKEQRTRRILVVRPGAVATNFWDKVPMQLPKNAASPEMVGERILEACDGGVTGVLDLT